jgi:hypothetical protein
MSSDEDLEVVYENFVPSKKTGHTRRKRQTNVIGPKNANYVIGPKNVDIGPERLFPKLDDMPTEVNI